MIVCSRPPERGHTHQFFGSKIATFYPLRYERAQSDSVSAHPSVPDHAAQFFEAAKRILAEIDTAAIGPPSRTCSAGGLFCLASTAAQAIAVTRSTISAGFTRSSEVQEVSTGGIARCSSRTAKHRDAPSLTAQSGRDGPITTLRHDTAGTSR